jgi:hypothetical protein
LWLLPAAVAVVAITALKPVATEVLVVVDTAVADLLEQEFLDKVSEAVISMAPNSMATQLAAVLAE